MLTIDLRSLLTPRDQETGNAREENGRNVLNGSGPEHRGDYSLPEAAYRRDVIREDKGRSSRDASGIRVGLTLSGDHPQQRPGRLDFPGLSIDPVTREVIADGNKVELTAREFNLLYFLARHQRHIFTRTHLLDAVWGHDFYGDESTVTVHISRLRCKLDGSTNDMDLIQTVWGVGYRFNPPCHRG